jgi:hypothetical protein
MRPNFSPNRGDMRQRDKLVPPCRSIPTAAVLFSLGQETPCSTTASFLFPDTEHVSAANFLTATDPSAARGTCARKAHAFDDSDRW